MTLEDAQTEAYHIMVELLPFSWIEKHQRDGTTKMQPRAVRMRDMIANRIMNAYSVGQNDGAATALENFS